MTTIKLDQDAVNSARLVDAASTIVALSTVASVESVAEAVRFLFTRTSADPCERSALRTIARIIQTLNYEDIENVRFNLEVNWDNGEEK
jgi:hypothetical protein